MTQPRILSSVEIEFQGQSQARQLIERTGFAIEVRHPQPGWPDEETRAKLNGFDALLAGGENLNAATMDQAANLKIIARNGVGFDKVDLDYCTQRRHRRHQYPGAMADAVADLTFALLLGMVRSLKLGDHRVKTADIYDVPVGEDLCAMTLGLVGCGRIGTEVVRRALGFKMRVLVHDPWIDDAQIRRPRCRACRPRHPPIPSRRRYLAPAADRGKQPTRQCRVPRPYERGSLPDQHRPRRLS